MVESASTPKATSFAEILVRQHTQEGVPGIKLAFHPDLLESIRLETHPLFWCAVTGDTCLAVMLYDMGYRHSEGAQLRCASFSSSGMNGSAPWRKVLRFSPHEAAKLAGHAETSRALVLMERGVPLRWARANHDAWPLQFRKRVAAAVRAAQESGLLCALPGAARLRTVAAIAEAEARDHVWEMVPSELWEASSYESLLGKQLVKEAKELCASVADGDADAAEDSEETQRHMPRYHFRVAGDPGTQWRTTHVAHAARLAVGIARAARTYSSARARPGLWRWGKSLVVGVHGAAFPVAATAASEVARLFRR